MSVWDKFPNYDDHELKRLVRITAEVLSDAGEGDELPPDVLQMSDKAAAREIKKELADVAPGTSVEQIQKLVAEPETSRKLSLKMLEEVRRQPELAEVVADMYEAQSRKMGDPILLLAAAPLLLLMIRVKRVDWKSRDGKGGKARSFTIELGDAAEAVKTLVKGLVTGVIGT